MRRAERLQARRQDLAQRLAAFHAMPYPLPLWLLIDEFRQHWACSRRTVFRDLAALRAEPCAPAAPNPAPHTEQQEEAPMTMTTPRWLALRAAWAQPTSDLHALRRARARQAYNRRRQEVAQARRRDLERLLTEFATSPCPPPLAMVYEEFQRHWVCSRRTFFRDLAAIRAARAAREAAREAARAQRAAAQTSGLPSAADPAPEPSDARGERRGRTHGGVWLRRYVALELTLCRTLPREVVDLVKARAAELTAELSAVPGAATLPATLPQLLAPAHPAPAPATLPQPARTRTREALGLPPWGEPVAPPRPMREPWE